jgi:hypothetical protein
VFDFSCLGVRERINLLIGKVFWFLFVERRKWVQVQLFKSLLALVDSSHLWSLLYLATLGIEDRTFPCEILTKTNDKDLLEELFLVIRGMGIMIQGKKALEISLDFRFLVIGAC